MPKTKWRSLRKKANTILYKLEDKMFDKVGWACEDDLCDCIGRELGDAVWEGVGSNANLLGAEIRLNVLY